VVPKILKKILRGFEKEGHGGAIAASFARNLYRRDKTRELMSTEDQPDGMLISLRTMG
jgi:hypothetical protein